MRTELLVVAALFLIASGCTWRNPFTPVSTPAPDSGYLRLQIVDSPLSGLRALNVTFSEVSIKCGGKWVLLDKSAKTFDLARLANKTADYGRYPVKPGECTGMRFGIKSVNALFDEVPAGCASLPFSRDGSKCQPVPKTYSAKVSPSSFELQHAVQVSPAADFALILDLHADSLARETGKLVFKPSAALLYPEEYAARLFNPKCGDGYCQRISCTGSDCPELETPENCPQDCSGQPAAQSGECVEHDGICCLASDPSKCSEALLACNSGAPAAFKGCEFRDGACFSLSQCAS